MSAVIGIRGDFDAARLRAIDKQAKDERPAPASLTWKPRSGGRSDCVTPNRRDINLLNSATPHSAKIRGAVHEVRPCCMEALRGVS